MKKFSIATLLLSALMIGGNVASATELSDISNLKNQISQVENHKEDKLSQIKELNEEIRIKKSLLKNDLLNPDKDIQKKSLNNQTYGLVKEIEVSAEDKLESLKNEVKVQNTNIDKLNSKLDVVVELDNKLESTEIKYSNKDKVDMQSKLETVNTMISEFEESKDILEDTSKVDETITNLQSTKSNLEEDIKNHVSGKEQVVQTALGFMGVPYVWGGKSPDGMDCSGLTQLAYRSVGREIGVWTVAQEGSGSTISVGEAERGDLLFWGGHGGTDHVAIYLGDGSYVHAPKPGESVKITTIADWSPDFAVRVM